MQLGSLCHCCDRVYLLSGVGSRIYLLLLHGTSEEFWKLPQCAPDRGRRLSSSQSPTVASAAPDLRVCMQEEHIPGKHRRRVHFRHRVVGEEAVTLPFHVTVLHVPWTHERSRACPTHPRTVCGMSCVAACAKARNAGTMHMQIDQHRKGKRGKIDTRLEREKGTDGERRRVSVRESKIRILQILMRIL